jgi:hypothetical protein
MIVSKQQLVIQGCIKPAGGATLHIVSGFPLCKLSALRLLRGIFEAYQAEENFPIALPSSLFGLTIFFS